MALLWWLLGRDDELAVGNNLRGQNAPHFSRSSSDSDNCAVGTWRGPRAGRAPYSTNDVAVHAKPANLALGGSPFTEMAVPGWPASSVALVYVCDGYGGGTEAM
jgi:hypothetical protein